MDWQSRVMIVLFGIQISCLILNIIIPKIYKDLDK